MREEQEDSMLKFLKTIFAPPPKQLLLPLYLPKARRKS